MEGFARQGCRGKRSSKVKLCVKKTYNHNKMDNRNIVLIIPARSVAIAFVRLSLLFITSCIVGVPTFKNNFVLGTFYAAILVPSIEWFVLGFHQDIRPPVIILLILYSYLRIVLDVINEYKIEVKELS